MCVCVCVCVYNVRHNQCTGIPHVHIAISYLSDSVSTSLTVPYTCTKNSTDYIIHKNRINHCIHAALNSGTHLT